MLYDTLIAAPVSSLKGVGPKKAARLAKMGLVNLGNLLDHYPRSYEDRTRLVTIMDAAMSEAPAMIKGRVVNKRKTFMRKTRGQMLTLTVEDQTARAEALFFQAAYVDRNFDTDQEFLFFGKVENRGEGRLQMVHPDFVRVSADGLVPEGFGGLVPVYPLTAGINQAEMRKLTGQVLDLAEEIPEYMPDSVLKKYNLCGIDYAIRKIHRPASGREMKAARLRLIFDELFMLQLGIKLNGEGSRSREEGISFRAAPNAMEEFAASLAFPLTAAQKRVLAEIDQDMNDPVPMNRLVQGDVGSGKTAVAQGALLKAVRCGYQGVIMAPTEILAKQHFEGFSRQLGPLGVRTGFLASSLSAKEKREVREALKRGEIHVLVGTHAVIQPDVEFMKLGLVVTDEQHRFGVNQRMLLTRKGANPDVLIMTATPIPRTLALTLYGDLAVSSIDEMPPGRKPVRTKVLDGAHRLSAYKFLAKQLALGHQAYVVAPLITDSEVMDLRSAESIYQEICGMFPSANPRLLHGEMKQEEKDAIMDEFVSGRASILVATVIIEVGINVPNATLMIIENAERFGLSQLHQLRGRVGRGRAESFCILISDSKTDVARQRGQVMETTNDGFVVAERDLELRGPGEFFGTRQHGLPELKLADLSKHMRLIVVQQPDIKEMLEKDPDLSEPEHALLRNHVESYYNFDRA